MNFKNFKTAIFFDRIFILINILILISCGNSENKFTKELWNEKEDIHYEKRKYIVDDLVENYLQIGIKYNEVIELLGQPNYPSKNEDNCLVYEVEVDYGFDVDPVKVVNLNLKFNTDSLLDSIKIQKWEK
jgi:hypothetical protein